MLKGSTDNSPVRGFTHKAPSQLPELHQNGNPAFLNPLDFQKINQKTTEEPLHQELYNPEFLQRAQPQADFIQAQGFSNEQIISPARLLMKQHAAAEDSQHQMAYEQDRFIAS